LRIVILGFNAFDRGHLWERPRDWPMREEGSCPDNGAHDDEQGARDDRIDAQDGVKSPRLFTRGSVALIILGDHRAQTLFANRWSTLARQAPDASPQLFGTSRDKPSVAQALAAQVIGVSNFALPGRPSGVEREVIGQLPSGFCVEIKKSIARLISGRSTE
jgi:hypothetical protein